MSIASSHPECAIVELNIQTFVHLFWHPPTFSSSITDYPWSQEIRVYCECGMIFYTRDVQTIMNLLSLFSVYSKPFQLEGQTIAYMHISYAQTNRKQSKSTENKWNLELLVGHPFCTLAYTLGYLQITIWPTCHVLWLCCQSWAISV